MEQFEELVQTLKGKLPVPVRYYLMIKPGCQSFLGGGLFANSFRKEHPQAQWLKFKSWYLEYPVPEDVPHYEAVQVLSHWKGFRCQQGKALVWNLIMNMILKQNQTGQPI